METTLLLGPPGTGKTKSLGDIFEKEIGEYGTPPHRIAYVSFTREGTYVGVQRIMERFNLKESALPFCRTWHSLVFKMIGARKEMMMDRKHYKQLSDALGMSFVGHYTADFIHDDDKLLFLNDLRRNNVGAFNRYMGKDVDFQKLNYVARQYTNYKTAFGVYDFTDLIEVALHSGEKIDVDAVFMDEAQDYPTIQWKLAYSLFGSAARWYIAGDDDQSIYAWAGADLDKFMSVSKNIHLLDTSWRLPDNVLSFAKRIGNRIKKRLPKDYHGTGKQGTLKTLAGFQLVKDELLKYPEETWLLLSRNNKFLSEFARILREAGLIYSYKGELSIKQIFLEWVHVYELASSGAQLGHAQTQTLEMFISDTTDLNKPWYKNTKINVEIVDYLRKYLELFPGQYKIPLDKHGNPRIRVNTIHTVKGAEAENVVVLSDISKQIETNLFENPDDEHRVFYVAVTRTSNRLFLVNNTLSKFSYNWPSLEG
jgi:superfamily I DNA/RNA helicase